MRARAMVSPGLVMFEKEEGLDAGAELWQVFGDFIMGFSKEIMPRQVHEEDDQAAVAEDDTEAPFGTLSRTLDAPVEASRDCAEQSPEAVESSPTVLAKL